MDLPSERPDALSVRLQAIAEQVARDFPAYTVAAEAFIQRLITARAGLGAPPIGAPMPPFLAPDANGGLTSLDSFAGRPLVVMFLRGHWCDFCRAQAQAMAQAADALEAAGVQVAVITPELPVYSHSLIADAPRFHLLSDLDNGYAATLGILALVDEALAQHLAGFAIDLPTYQGAQGWAVPIPATFVVDALGLILYRAIDPDFRRRPSLQALLDAIPRAKV